MEGRHPYTSVEFTANLREEINDLQSGLETHCMWQYAARDTTTGYGTVRPGCMGGLRSQKSP